MRPNLAPIFLLVLASACENNFQQGLPPKTDDSVPNTDSGAEADADADADADTDTDTDADSDPVWAGDCGNYWDPIDLNNWSRNYTVDYDGQAGTETHTGYGEVSTGRYRYDLNLSVGSGDGYYGEVLVDCDPNGNEGLYIGEWNVDYLFGGSPFANISGTHDSNRMYMPDESVIPGIGSWTYNYNLTASADMDSGAPTDIGVAVSGTYVELGSVDTTVDGQAVSGLRLTNTYTMTSDGGGFAPFERNGYIDQTWVAGIGMVSETHTWTMDDGSSHSMTKTLSSHSSLTVFTP